MGTQLRLAEKGIDALKCQGYAIIKGELVYKVADIAAPVFNHDNKVIVSIMFTGPIQRLTGKDLRTKRVDLLDASRTLSTMFGYAGSCS